MFGMTTDDGPPYPFPRPRQTGDYPHQINVRNPDAIADLVDIRDLLNAQVFFGSWILGHHSVIRILAAHWRENPPEELWKTEKAVELKPKHGRPERLQKPFKDGPHGSRGIPRA